MIIDNLNEFLDKTINAISKFEIDISGLEMDHIGYQASSDADYDKLVPKFRELGEMVTEEIVGGRRVGMFKLNEKIHYKNYTISAFELIAPKEGQVCPSALEHVEFVLKESFDSFLAKYPQIDWDKSAIDQKDFPLIKLRLSENTQVKFHLTNLLEIVSK